MGKATRERSARDRLADERKVQAQRDKQKRMMTVIGSAAGVMVLVVGLGIFINSNKNKGDDFTGSLPPVTREADGAVSVAKAGVTAPVLEIYEDFQCPACKNLEKTSGDTFKRLAAEGKAKLVYRPFWLFQKQQEPLRGNSLRAANASYCAPADAGWVGFHDKIFANQPNEGSNGFSNADLIKWAGESGISGEPFTKCVNGGEKNAQVEAMSATATKAGVQSSPTVKLDGKDITNDAFVPKNLEKAVLAAGK